jgi:tRNA threonylcarbamoyladenosine biosynthesis protein TsaB
MAQTAMDIHELLKELERMDRRVIFLGDGVPVYGEVIRKECAVPFSFAPAHLNAQRAGSVVALGEVYYAQGRTISSDEHGPEYLRKSQAEREKEERAQGNAK